MEVISLTSLLMCTHSCAFDARTACVSTEGGGSFFLEAEIGRLSLANEMIVLLARDDTGSWRGCPVLKLDMSPVQVWRKEDFAHNATLGWSRTLLCVGAPSRPMHDGSAPVQSGPWGVERWVLRWVRCWGLPGRWEGF